MNSKLLSIGLTTALALSGGLLGKIGCQNMELSSVNEKLNKELMQSNLELGRAHTQFGNANDYKKELESKIRTELKKREANLTRIGKLKARLRLYRKGKGKNKKRYKNKDAVILKDTHGLSIGMVYQVMPGQKLVPFDIDISYKDYHIDILTTVRPESNTELNVPTKVSYNLDLKLRGVFAESITPTGAINNYFTLYEIDNEGKDVQKLELTQFDMIVEDKRKAEWYWWAPHVDIGTLAMIGTLPPRFVTGASVGFSMMGYGLTKNDLQWRVLRLSVDFSAGGIGMGFTPGLYNLGSFFPIISNLWIGPHLFYGMPGEWRTGLFIGGVL